MSYKALFEDWGDYMNQLNNVDYANFFTPVMENNTFMDFNEYIKTDMKTFLTVIAGNAKTVISL